MEKVVWRYNGNYLSTGWIYLFSLWWIFADERFRVLPLWD